MIQHSIESVRLPQPRALLIEASNNAETSRTSAASSTRPKPPALTQLRGRLSVLHHDENRWSALWTRVTPIGLTSAATLLLLVGCATPSSPNGGGYYYQATDTAVGDAGSTADTTVAVDANTTNNNGDTPGGSCTPNCDGKTCDNGCGGSCDTQACDDSNPCTGQDRCYAAICKGQPTVSCDDGNPCTKDLCDPGTGCKSAPATGTYCNDGDVCTTSDICQGSTCVGTGSLACNDGNPCTADTCKSGIGCSFAKTTNLQKCGSGVCVAGSCCTCPGGKKCNSKGLCVSPNSCLGRCGSAYDSTASCQCDSGCKPAGDCCADMAALCSNCKPAAAKKCCGESMCQYDSCGALEKTEKCPFGCDAKSDKCTSDPCAGVTENGECLGKTGYFSCVMTTGSSKPPKLKYSPCSSSEACDDTYGFAFCLPKPTACTPGTMKCIVGQTNKSKSCQDDGTWKEETCAGCALTYLDGIVACPGTIKLTNLSAKVQYQAVGPNQSYTGYAMSKPWTSPVQQALVLSLRYSADFSSSTMLDAAVVAENGTFDLDVPANVLPTRDYVLVAAVAFDPKTKKFLLAIQKPSTKKTKIELTSTTALTGKPYTWAAAVSTIKAGGVWTIGTNEQSWALHLYDWARYVYYTTKSAAMFGKPGRSLIIWAREGTDFDCGACFAPWPVKSEMMAGGKAHSQLFLSSSDSDHLSLAVIGHELGHWAMSSFGTSPNEAGTHYFGTKVPPGMAWSEGWATFFSSMTRSNPIYYSGNSTGMFWVNLASKKYGKGTSLLPFSSGSKVLQFMDENRVASALWHLGTLASDGMLSVPANKPLWQALAAKHMNNGIFLRGYLRQVWEKVTPNTGGPYNATYTGMQSTGIFAPTLIDYIDTLLCLAPQLNGKIWAATSPLSYVKGKCLP